MVRNVGMVLKGICREWLGLYTPIIGRQILDSLVQIRETDVLIAKQLPSSLHKIVTKQCRHTYMLYTSKGGQTE